MSSNTVLSASTDSKSEVVESITRFYNSVVAPSVAKLELNFSDFRKVFNAVHAVDALAAHIFVVANQLGRIRVAHDDLEFRNKLSEQSEYFALLRDVAKAQKHVVLIRGNPRIVDSREIGQRSLGCGEMRWGEGRWGSPPQVCAKVDQNQFRPVDAIVLHSLKFLQEEMVKLGFIVFWKSSIGEERARRVRHRRNNSQKLRNVSHWQRRFLIKMQRNN